MHLDTLASPYPARRPMRAASIRTSIALAALLFFQPAWASFSIYEFMKASGCAVLTTRICDLLNANNAQSIYSAAQAQLREAYCGTKNRQNAMNMYEIGEAPKPTECAFVLGIARPTPPSQTNRAIEDAKSRALNAANEKRRIILERSALASEKNAASLSANDDMAAVESDYRTSRTFSGDPLGFEAFTRELQNAAQRNVELQRSWQLQQERGRAALEAARPAPMQPRQRQAQESQDTQALRTKNDADGSAIYEIPRNSAYDRELRTGVQR